MRSILSSVATRRSHPGENVAGRRPVIGVAGLTIAASSGILSLGGDPVEDRRTGCLRVGRTDDVERGGIAIGLAAAARFSAQNTQAWLGVFSLVAGILL